MMIYVEVMQLFSAVVFLVTNNISFPNYFYITRSHYTEYELLIPLGLKQFTIFL